MFNMANKNFKPDVKSNAINPKCSDLNVISILSMFVVCTFNSKYPADQLTGQVHYMVIPR